jgi:hypothetical protein
VWNFVFLAMIYMSIQIMTVFLLKKQEK